MRKNIAAAAAAAAIMLSCCSLTAQAASFLSQQILVLGSPRVSALGMNDRGTIVGTYQPSPTETAGFVLQGSTLYILPQSYPTAINRTGAVAGFGNNGGFVWQNGSFLPGVNFPVGTVDGMPPTVLLNNRGVVAYTQAQQSAQQVYAGTPEKPHLQKGLSTSHAFVTAINNHNVLAGFELATINGAQTPALFVGKAGLYDLIIPSISGFSTPTNVMLNDAGQIAFTNGQQLLLFSAGVTTQIAMPTSQASSVQVMGYNNSGRIAGVYTDRSQTPAVQTVFFFNGHTVSTFGAFAAADTVHVALNNFGVMVISDAPTGTASAGVSYRVICKGSDC